VSANVLAAVIVIVPSVSASTAKSTVRSALAHIQEPGSTSDFGAYSFEEPRSVSDFDTYSFLEPTGVYDVAASRPNAVEASSSGSQRQAGPRLGGRGVGAAASSALINGRAARG